MSAKTVAEFMKNTLDEKKYLYQESAVYTIKKQFGDQFVYQNQNGNLAISKEVLREFRKMTEDTVVWERGERRWRLKKEGEKSGRQVDQRQKY